VQDVANAYAAKRRVLDAHRLQGGAGGVSKAVEAAEARIQELEAQVGELIASFGGSPAASGQEVRALKVQLADAEERIRRAEQRAERAEAREARAREEFNNDKAILLERTRKAMAAKAESDKRARQRRQEEEKQAWEEAERAAREQANVSSASELVMESQRAKQQLKLSARKLLEEKKKALELEHAQAEEVPSSVDQEEVADDQHQKAASGKDGEQDATSGTQPEEEAKEQRKIEEEELAGRIEELGQAIRARKEELGKRGLTPAEVNKSEEVSSLVAQLVELKRSSKAAAAEEEGEEGEDRGPPELSMEEVEERDDMQTALDRLTDSLQGAGFSANEVEEDPDVKDLREALEGFGVDVPKTDKVKQWDQEHRYKTKKQSLTAWYHRKYLRRTGRSGAHWFNKLSGKSHKEKKRLTKQFIQKKIKAHSKAKRQRHSDSNLQAAPEPELLEPSGPQSWELGPQAEGQQQ